VFDIQQNKRFETRPRNVCATRDFNRIAVEGLDPNLIEKSMGEFESLINPAIAQIDRSNSFSGEPKEIILNLMSILATRHPGRRENMRQVQEKLVKIAMGMVVATPERFSSVIDEATPSSADPAVSVSYDEMKSFVERDQFKIEVTNEHHLHMEDVASNAVLDCLYNRQWRLVRADPIHGHFVTSDNPVSLTWRNPENVPPFYRSSPGHAMPDTELCFTLTKELALVGAFDGVDELQYASQAFVAAVNTKVFFNSYRQLFSSKRTFTALSSDYAIIDGHDFIQKHRRR
jgi:hypothetical protein